MFDESFLCELKSEDFESQDVSQFYDDLAALMFNELELDDFEYDVIETTEEIRLHDKDCGSWTIEIID